MLSGDKNLASDAEFRIHDGTIDVINFAFHKKISSTFPFISASINAEVRELSNDACRLSTNDVTHRYCSITMHHVCTRSRCLFSFELAEPIVANKTVTAFTNSSTDTNRKTLFQLQEKLFDHLNANILNLALTYKGIQRNIFNLKCSYLKISFLTLYLLNICMYIYIKFYFSFKKSYLWSFKQYSQFSINVYKRIFSISLTRPY